MTKKKKLVKQAIAHPESYSPAEIQFFKFWLEQRKIRKDKQKKVALQ